MRISDWSSDVCSSDLIFADTPEAAAASPMFMSSSRGGFGKPLAAAFRCEKDVGMQVAIPQVPLPADLPYRLYHGWRARAVGLPPGHVVDVPGNGLLDEACAKPGGFRRPPPPDGIPTPGVCGPSPH